MKAKYADPSYGFTHNGLKNYQVSFVPAITINCNPPYVAGQRDSLWVVQGITPLPKPTDKAGWERKLGMSLLPLD